MPADGRWDLRSTKFNFKKSYVLPTQLYLCFVWISQQTEIISLYNIN